MIGDVELGALLMGLSEQFAIAWTTGNEELAERWLEAAFRVRGHDTFIDANEHKEADR